MEADLSGSSDPSRPVRDVDPVVAKSAHYWWAYGDDLYRAIGRVSAASALYDELLTELLDELLGTEDAGRLFVGQSSDWLAQSCRILFDDSTMWRRKYPAEARDRFFELLGAADSLRHLRNRIIHGIWTKDRFHDENSRPRPWGDWDDEVPFYCSRGRIRKGTEEQAFTITDINRVADELSRVRDGLAALYVSLEPERANTFRVLPRWVEQPEHLKGLQERGLPIPVLEADDPRLVPSPELAELLRRAGEHNGDLS
jgi:hypothetical protein